MERSGRLNMDDPLQKECFLFVFVPEVETAVSEYVQVWNLHLVRQINENGCFRGSLYLNDTLESLNVLMGGEIICWKIHTKQWMMMT
jgi:hypothetical protein